MSENGFILSLSAEKLRDKRENYFHDLHTSSLTSISRSLVLKIVWTLQREEKEEQSLFYDGDTPQPSRTTHTRAEMSFLTKKQVPIPRPAKEPLDPLK